MATFRSTDPREPSKDGQLADYIPLRGVKRNSQNKNVWNEDGDDENISETLQTDRVRVSWEEDVVGRQSLESNASLDVEDLDPDAESTERLIQGHVYISFGTS